ncbi:SpoVK/Ycf46/Vps4 family AAA+-type ATPase [Neobacillus drentensis]|nr:SpoVK/Ycf46/Vps4 family AAA+-type ATPase [Neobacillus drentensis]
MSKGHLVEVTREDLVGEYIGQTAIKTRKVIEKAKGGVLFIDEAYSLARGTDTQDYGREAIDTLVKCMEEYRGNLVIILAGYTYEMNSFINVNSGLNSRFAKKITFPDYSDAELLEIAKWMLIKQGFTITIETERAIAFAINQRNIKGDNTSGNGRLVRNVIEEAIRKQSQRLIDSGDKENYHQLLPADFGFIKEQVNIYDLLNNVIGHQ